MSFVIMLIVHMYNIQRRGSFGCFSAPSSVLSLRLAPSRVAFTVVAGSLLTSRMTFLLVLASLPIVIVSSLISTHTYRKY